jgi:hypothetical protein
MTTKHVKMGVEATPKTSFMTNIYIAGTMDTVQYNFRVFRRYVLSSYEISVQLICRHYFVTTE